MLQNLKNSFNKSFIASEDSLLKNKDTEKLSVPHLGENLNNTLKKTQRVEWVWSIVWILVITLLVLKFAVYQQVNVIGESMEPNFSTGQMLLVNTVNKNIKRGQVTAVYEDKDAGKNSNYFTRFNTKFYLKRIIGLPNEEIEIIGSSVIIYNSQYPDGFELKEDYVSARAKLVEDQKKYYFAKMKIPPDSYFVMGDNRSNSTDSRIRGSFPSYDIFGQETLKYWPFEKAGLFQIPEYSQESLSDTLKNIRDEYRLKYQKEVVQFQ
jgi:signal peptidase I